MNISPRLSVRLSLLAACIIAVGLQGCGNSSSDNPLQSSAGEGAPTSPLVPQQIANQAVMALVSSGDGSSVTVTDTASPIVGAGVVLSRNALPQSQEIIQIGYEDALPAPLPAGLDNAVQASKVLVLERSNPTDLSYPADISLPYDKTKLKESDIPQLLYFDPVTNSYLPVTISEVDAAAGVVRFRSAHFSRYVLVSVTPAAALPDVDSGFRPDVDGFFIRKTSDAQTSYAMSAFATWFNGRKSTVGHDLFNAYREGDPAIEDDDLAVRELVGRLMMHTDSALLQDIYVNGVARQTQIRVGQSLIAAMQLSNKPQILLMGDAAQVRKAVVVYAYDAANARFLVYDTDFPAEVVHLPFGPNGFGHYTKDINNDLTTFALDDASRSYSADYLESALRGVESGWGNTVEQVAAARTPVAGLAAAPAVAITSFPKVHITQPAVNVKNPLYYDIASEDNVVIAGNVDAIPGSQAARYMHVYVDGVSFNSGTGDNDWHKGSNPAYQMIPIDAQGNFQFTIPKVNATGSNITMLVSLSPSVAGSTTGYSADRGQVTSFKAIRVKVPSADFFNNLSFEQGDFSFWLSELRRWFGSVLANPSPDSAIVQSGLDPIANTARSLDPNQPVPNLNMVRFGKYAARINDSANGTRISRVTQEAMVPSTGNPVIHFNWAAVLEDVGHAASQQPYVDIKITDLTDGVVLKQYHFYAYDPLYTGWQSYAATQDAPWRAIPWQTVDFPVKAYAGHTLQLQVEAADCANSGHGGYVYLDAE